MSTLIGKRARVHKACPWDGCEGTITGETETREGPKCFFHPDGWPEGSGGLYELECLEVLE